MATLTNYSITRMGARVSMLQPASATPALCDTEQVIILLCLPLAEGNSTNSEGHSSLPVCNFEGPRMNMPNTIVQPEMTKREQCRHGSHVTHKMAGDRTARRELLGESALLAPYGCPCIC